jgi:hypothetical protein
LILSNILILYWMIGVCQSSFYLWRIKTDCTI